ncbi:Spx/MgsR family RNA polymerase-binding regulatory protein [Youngiibacter multivorans]|uniref:Arsenate reductase n=1 Tax=Youngiibacter multivorans TaxID=937251 RepID=A0ABS4G6D0_9CLOT|nr:Spx/MgsR family RNA polymerase-binding regulatory protein [Youngiibacter multivorans]MBP1920079.1 arsenate reductase [Youngiibacter multivorans]
MELIGYNKCGTCQKARKYLSSRDISYEWREITERPPGIEELRSILSSGVELRKLLNTSGQAYRELNMKEMLGRMSQEEVLLLLSKTPMLVKRPILRTDISNTLVGFNEEEWNRVLK